MASNRGFGRFRHSSYQSFDIDHIQLICHDMKGDCNYQLQVSVWEHLSTHDTLSGMSSLNLPDKGIATLH